MHANSTRTANRRSWRALAEERLAEWQAASAARDALGLRLGDVEAEARRLSAQLSERTEELRASERRLRDEIAKNGALDARKGEAEAFAAQRLEALRARSSNWRPSD